MCFGHYKISHVAVAVSNSNLAYRDSSAFSCFSKRPAHGTTWEAVFWGHPSSSRCYPSPNLQEPHLWLYWSCSKSIKEWDCFIWWKHSCSKVTCYIRRVTNDIKRVVHRFKPSSLHTRGKYCPTWQWRFATLDFIADPFVDLASWFEWTNCLSRWSNIEAVLMQQDD